MTKLIRFYRTKKEEDGLPSTLYAAIQGNKSSYPTRTHRIVFVFVVIHFTVAKRMLH